MDDNVKLEVGKYYKLQYMAHYDKFHEVYCKVLKKKAGRFEYVILTKAGKQTLDLSDDYFKWWHYVGVPKLRGILKVGR